MVSSRSPIINALFKLSLPLIMARMSRVIGSVIATVLVAQLGKSELAAYGLAWPYFLTLILFMTGVMTSVSLAVSKHFGANEHDQICQVVASGIGLALILSIPSVLIFYFSNHLFLLFGQSPSLVVAASSVLRAFALGMPAQLLSMLGQQFLIGIHRPMILSIIFLFGLFLQIIFYYGFIFGYWGFPKLGLEGVGYGWSLSTWITFIISVIYIVYHPTIGRFKILTALPRASLKTILFLLSYGWMIGAALVIEAISLLTYVLFIGRVNIDALAAYQVVFPIYILVLIIPVAIAQAMTVLISKDLGARQLQRVKYTVIMAMLTALFFMFPCALAFWLLPDKIVYWLTHNRSAEVTACAVLMMRLMGVVLLVDIIRLITVGALRGLRDVYVPMWFNLLCFWGLGIPLAAIVVVVLKLNPELVWVVNGLVVLLISLLAGRRLLTKFRDLGIMPS